jgi:hypothetical protein
MAVTDDDVRRVVGLMRELGVQKLHGMGLAIELGPAPAPKDEKPAPRVEEEPPCACGHPTSEHGDAGCLHGCDLGRCGPLEKVPEEEKKA